jgi:hypothetical protein
MWDRQLNGSIKNGIADVEFGEKGEIKVGADLQRKSMEDVRNLEKYKTDNKERKERRRWTIRNDPVHTHTHHSIIHVPSTLWSLISYNLIVENYLYAKHKKISLYIIIHPVHASLRLTSVTIGWKLSIKKPPLVNKLFITMEHNHWISTSRYLAVNPFNLIKFERFYFLILPINKLFFLFQFYFS